MLLAAEKAAKAMGFSDARALLEKRGKGKTVGSTVWRQLSETEFPGRRPLSLYTHVKRKLEPRGYRGSWTEEESVQLRTLFESLGPDWKTISAELGRTAENCRDRFRRVFGEPQYYDASRGHEREARRLKRGKWTDDETERLASAKANGRSVLEVNGPEDVNFVKLSKRVGTRSGQQCQRRWEFLRGESINLLKFPAHQLELCEKLASANAHNIADIDWEHLFGHDRARKARACYRRLAMDDDTTASFKDNLEAITNRLRDKVHDDMLRQWGERHTTDDENNDDEDHRSGEGKKDGGEEKDGRHENMDEEEKGDNN